MKHYIIAFSGKARSGKNTSAEIMKKLLEETNLYDVSRKAFADKLKQIARSLFFWNDEKDVHPDFIKDKGRNLLIHLGNKMREIRPLVWVEYILQNIRFEIKEELLDAIHSTGSER